MQVLWDDYLILQCVLLKLLDFDKFYSFFADFHNSQPGGHGHRLSHILGETIHFQATTIPSLGSHSHPYQTHEHIPISKNTQHQTNKYHHWDILTWTDILKEKKR